jgi:2-polyprenyl-6-methoxyphenol hydroxylase-like FAD-dependent oxidoreductase
MSQISQHATGSNSQIIRNRIGNRVKPKRREAGLSGASLMDPLMMPSHRDQETGAASARNLSPQDRASPAVLIVGAGTTGLTLACELARRGVSIRVIEAAAKEQAGSRSKGLQPRSMEVFDDLGIGDRVRANARLAIPMHLTGPDGRKTLGGAIPEGLRDRPDIPYPASFITPVFRTEDALRRRLGGFGVAVEFGATLSGFDQSAEGVSAVVVTADRSETISARWLVGCDGGHSLVRKQCGIKFEGVTREEVQMLIADLTVEGLDGDAWHMWRHEEGFLGLCPLPSTNLFQFQAHVGPGESTELSLANFQAMLERRTGRTDIRLKDPEWTSYWRANIRLAERYRAGHVFLAGDAAHVHAPAGGQGMNTGIQDAQNLGWKLAAVIDGASPALLETYEAERRPVAAGAIELSNARLERTLDPESIGIHRDESTIQLHIGYRGSPLARDDRDETDRLRAGDRAPDATGLVSLSGKHRLFELTRGGRFTLLSFGPMPRVHAAPFEIRSLEVVAQPQAPDQIADAEGHLARLYGATERTLVLIRPDGYIGLISDDGHASAVDRYFAALR